jgi:hypothetical protein
MISGDGMRLQSKQWFVLGGVLSIAAALLHVAVIFGGAPAYRYFGAGEEMAKMAEAGSVLPAVATTFIVVIFAVWGLYAFSGAGLIRKLPYLRPGMIVIAAIYTLRGIAVVPEAIWVAMSPKAIPAQEIIFSLVSLFIGITYIVGIKTAKGKQVAGVESR